MNEPYYGFFLNLLCENKRETNADTFSLTPCKILRFFFQGPAVAEVRRNFEERWICPSDDSGASLQLHHRRSRAKTRQDSGRCGVMQCNLEHSKPL